MTPTDHTTSATRVLAGPTPTPDGGRLRLALDVDDLEASITLCSAPFAGVEVAKTATVHEEIARLSAAGLLTEAEMGTTCCFAVQDEVWVTGPAGERWEVFTVLADTPADV